MAEKVTSANATRASSGDEKVDSENIEDVKIESQPQARISRFTKEEEEAVIRKLDWHLMPLIFVLYSISVLDRSNLGNAVVAGMNKDIDLSGNRYAWLGTIFYISCKSIFQHIKSRTLITRARHPLPMDPNGLENIPTPYLGGLRCLRLGRNIIRPSRNDQLGGADGLSIPARHP